MPVPFKTNNGRGKVQPCLPLSFTVERTSKTFSPLPRGRAWTWIQLIFSYYRQVSCYFVGTVTFKWFSKNGRWVRCFLKLWLSSSMSLQMERFCFDFCCFLGSKFLSGLTWQIQCTSQYNFFRHIYADCVWCGKWRKVSWQILSCSNLRELYMVKIAIFAKPTN